MNWLIAQAQGSALADLRGWIVDLGPLLAFIVAAINWAREWRKRTAAETETKSQEVALNDLDLKVAKARLKLGENLGEGEPPVESAITFEEQQRQLEVLVKEKGLRPKKDAWQVWNKGAERIPVVVIHKGKGVNRRVLLPNGTTELVPIPEVVPLADNERRAA